MSSGYCYSSILSLFLSSLFPEDHCWQILLTDGLLREGLLLHNTIFKKIKQTNEIILMFDSLIKLILFSACSWRMGQILWLQKIKLFRSQSLGPSASPGHTPYITDAIVKDIGYWCHREGQPDLVTWGPMRGLKKVDTKRGHMDIATLWKNQPRGWFFENWLQDY